MKIVVGLGNPGKRYAGTRHNVGFEVLDHLAKSPHAGRFAHRFDADVAESMEGNHKVLLVKPQTYMNLSGRVVRQVVDFYRVEPTELLIVCDDVNLPLGQLRARARGTHGGHNGLRDIQNHLGTTEYSRLRIGVGGPDGRDLADHVLDTFRPTEKAVVADANLTAMQAVGLWIQQGIEACMNQYNTKKSDK